MLKNSPKAAWNLKLFVIVVESLYIKTTINSLNALDRIFVASAACLGLKAHCHCIHVCLPVCSANFYLPFIGYCWHPSKAKASMLIAQEWMSEILGWMITIRSAPAPLRRAKRKSWEFFWLGGLVRILSSCLWMAKIKILIWFQRNIRLFNAKWKGIDLWSYFFWSVWIPLLFIIVRPRFPFGEVDWQKAVSLNNRNTDRQLPSPEGVRLKSWSIFLCNICIKMAGSAPASHYSLCSPALSASSPNLLPKGAQLPHHWGVNTLMNLPFTFDTWYVKAGLLFRSDERCFDNVNISLQHAE